MVSKHTSSSLLRMYSVAAAAAATVGLVDYLIGLWLASLGRHAEGTLLDEILVALFAGALVLVIELSHRRSQERMSEQLKTIELMNHHVRNALQTIVTSAYVHGHAQQLDEIRTSVNRIEWACKKSCPVEY